MKSGSNVHIYPTGVLDASGTQANVTALSSLTAHTNQTDALESSAYANATLLGAGSGGSVAIMGVGVSQEGFITVAGGPAATVSGIGAGAAGGGGRVSIQVKRSMTCDIFNELHVFYIMCLFNVPFECFI